MATISVPSLETRSSFQPRFRMSARHPMSFSHSFVVVRKTRRSATCSHWGGYGLDGGVMGRWRVGPYSQFCLSAIGGQMVLSLGWLFHAATRGLPAAPTSHAASL